MLHGVILAGGSGTRFWPQSRKKNPKQFLSIAGSESMIQMTVDRLSSLIPVENQWIVANGSHTEIIQVHLPHLPLENILVEPVGKNTAPAIGLAALQILEKDPEGMMLVLPADHLISNVDGFLSCVKNGVEMLRQESDLLLTFGIVPTSPETGYGYIHAGRPIDKGYYVQGFIEKPSKDRAQTLLSDGGYYWNSGMFLWKASIIAEKIRQYLPAVYEGLICYRKGDREAYSKIPSISVDYGVLEKDENIAVIPAEIGWNDIGSWTSLEDVLKQTPEGNAVHGTHICIDTQGSIIFSPKKLVATIGIRDLVIVDTDDALLICHKDQAQDVKKLVDRLKEKGMEEYL